MFSLTDPERIHAVLTRAGFAHITVVPLVVPMVYGSDASDAAEMYLGTGPARFHLKDAGRATEAQAQQAVTAALRPFEHPGGVRLRGAYWLVNAAAPNRTYGRGETS